MSLTWHIVLKDLRRLSPWLALLVAATLLRYAQACAFELGLLDFKSLPQPWRDPDTFQGIDYFLHCLTLVATALGAATLVHLDPLTGGNNFWVTRPISGLRLVAAKTLTILLAFAVLPFALQIGWWKYHQFSLANILPQLPFTTLPFIVVAFAALACGLLTRSLPAFLLTAFTIVIAGIATLIVLSRVHPITSSPESLTRQCLQIAILTSAVIACIVAQYLTRRARLTISIAVTAALLCIATGTLWQWPLFSPRGKKRLPCSTR